MATDPVVRPGRDRSRSVWGAAVVAGLALVPLLAWALAGPDAVPVRTEAPVWRELRPSVFASGLFVHGLSARVTSEVVGTVTAVHVVEGQSVTVGEVLLEIDSKGYEAQIDHHQATVRLRDADIERARLAIARLTSQHRRTERLHRAGLLDADTYENAVHGLRLAELDLVAGREARQQARAALAQSLDQLEKARVVAPLNGVVAALAVEVGETAIAGTINVPGSELVEVADPASLLAEVHLDESDLDGVRVGQSAVVVPAADSERSLTGTVQFIAATAKFRPNSRSRSFRVRIALDDAAASNLRAGMSCRAEVFLAGADQALSIPIAAIVSSDEPATGAPRHFVYTVGRAGGGKALPGNAGAVTKVEIELGRADDEYQEVAAGLAATDLVVVGPNRTLRGLREGDAVVAMAE